MILDELIQKNHITKYRLAIQAGVPQATLSDICTGKTRIEKCSAGTIYRLAKALQVPMEMLIEQSLNKEAETERKRSYEYGLPDYLQNDLDRYKEASVQGSDIIDCLWGELYGSINAAEITDGVITSEHADYLRRKYLWGDQNV